MSYELKIMIIKKEKRKQLEKFTRKDKKKRKVIMK